MPGHGSAPRNPIANLRPSRQVNWPAPISNMRVGMPGDFTRYGAPVYYDAVPEQLYASTGDPRLYAYSSCVARCEAAALLENPY